MLRSEDEIVQIEQAFEDSKAKRFKANMEFKAAKGEYHTKLIARREAGEILTIADMKALEDSAINRDPKVQSAYLEFIKADGAYRLAKVEWESAKRAYWDSKPN